MACPLESKTAPCKAHFPRAPEEEPIDPPACGHILENATTESLAFRCTIKPPAGTLDSAPASITTVFPVVLSDS